MILSNVNMREKCGLDIHLYANKKKYKTRPHLDHKGMFERLTFCGRDKICDEKQNKRRIFCFSLLFAYSSKSSQYLYKID